MLEQIEKVLDTQVRPKLAFHGGDIRSVSCEERVYRFQLLGQCASCPSAYLTVETLIREKLLAEIPGLIDVVLEQGVSDELLAQARTLLKQHHG